MEPVKSGPRDDDWAGFPVSPGYAYGALAFLTLVYVLCWMHRIMLSIFLEPIRLELGFSDTQLGLLTGLAFTLAYPFSAIPIARLADRGSRPLILGACMLLWTIATSALGLAQNFIQLAICRMGVGIGESGFAPVAGSLLASYFPPKRLSLAIAIWTAGSATGAGLAYPVGALLLGQFGWRHALTLSGLVGVATALVALVFLREPRRTTPFSKQSATVEEAPLTWSAILSIFLARRTILFICIGGALTTYGDAAAYTWFPAFMTRTHGMSAASLAWSLGIVIGLTQAVGLLVGGFAINLLSKRDERWAMWLPAICLLLAGPLTALVYLTDEAQLATWGLMPPLFLSTVYFAPTLALVQIMVPIRMRAVTMASFYICVNVLGFGLGPLLIGAISDMLAPFLHLNSLRYALLTAPVSYVAASLAFFLAASSLREDVIAGRPLGTTVASPGPR